MTEWSEENPQVKGLNYGMSPEMAQSIGQANKQLEELGNSLSSVKLARGTKGGYAWEIKAYCEDIDKAKQKVEQINLEWVQKYGSV